MEKENQRNNHYPRATDALHEKSQAMHESLFDHVTDTTHYFGTQQLQDALQSVLNEIDSRRLLTCVIGFPKSGKTAFVKRLKSALRPHSVTVTVSPDRSLAQSLALHPQVDDRPALGALLQDYRHVVLILDNAHLLTDQDFAHLRALLARAEQQQVLLQVVLVGNGEIVHRLARPDNRTVYNMLGAIWHLPKLTREQSLAYVRALLTGAGLSRDLIHNPEILVKRAAGVIGILRALTITLAIRALGSEAACDAREALDPECATRLAEQSRVEEALPTQAMIRGASPWAAGLLAMSLGAIIILFVLGVLWFVPGTSITSLFTSSGNTPDQANFPPPPTELTTHIPQSVAKTVFRKRTTDGPYSLQLGTYPTMEAMLLHLPRFTGLPLPLFWNKDRGEQEPFVIFAGRFETFEMAGAYAAQNRLGGSPVVFRPYVATAGPLTNPEEVRWASLAVGLHGEQKMFERELVAGVEIQFALERSREEALTHCDWAEKKGLSCAVTQYE